jgi:hypothetical protein
MTETQPGPLASPPGHPDLDTLADFGAGVLDPAESVQLQAHVNACARCQGVLAGSAAVPDLLRTLPPIPMPPAVEARIFAALSAERRATQRQPGPVPVRPPVPVVSLDLARERRAARMRTLSKVAAGLILVVGIGAGVVALNKGGTSTSNGGAGSAAGVPERQQPVGAPHDAAALPDYSRATITGSPLLIQILTGTKGPLSAGGATDRLRGCELGVAQQVPAAGANPAGVQHIRFEGTPAYALAYSANGRRTLVVVAETCTEADPQVLFTEPF